MNIPELRFPEFSGEWEEKKISKILEIHYGKDYKHLNRGDVPVYGTGGLMAYVDNYLYDGESVLIGRKGTISKPFYVNEPFWTVDTLFYTIIVGAKAKFAYYLISTINWLRYNEASGVPSLSANNIKNVKVKIPSFSEQEKIASFLSKVDEKIEKLEKKQELWETYKKGIMQQIFSQKLRFKDENGEDYPDWEDKKLGDISNITTGKLDANAMVEKGDYRFYTCAKEYYYIDKYAFDTDALLISGNGANVGYVHQYNGKFNAYQRTYVLDKFEENIIFVKYILEQNLKKRIEQEKNQGNTPYIVLSTLRDMNLDLPEKQEQEKIALFLSNIDFKINQITNEFKFNKEFKKGLMQQLFC